MNPSSVFNTAPQMGGMPTAPAAGAGGAGTSATADPSQFGNYSDWAQGELAKGFTPDQLHQHLQASGVDTGATGAQPHSGNWFTHLLPTIGGLAGVLLAPETGGLSLLAAAGLSGLGAAGGKLAE